MLCMLGTSVCVCACYVCTHLCECMCAMLGMNILYVCTVNYVCTEEAASQLLNFNSILNETPMKLTLTGVSMEMPDNRICR